MRRHSTIWLMLAYNRMAIRDEAGRVRKLVRKLKRRGK